MRPIQSGPDSPIAGRELVDRPRHGRGNRRAQLKVEERSFTLAEAQAADEAFITSASAFVMPVVEIDGVKLGGGKPGPVAVRLREIYLEESRKAAI